MVPTRHDDDDDEMMMIQPNNEATNLLVSSVDDADDFNPTNTTANSPCSRNATKIGALLVICVGLAFTLLYTVTINNTFTEGIGNDNSNDIVISKSYQNILDIDTNAETDTDLDTDLDDKDLVDSTNSDAIKAALDASKLDQSDKDGFLYLARSYDKDEAQLKLNAENGLYSLSPLPEPDANVKAWLASVIDQADEIIQKDPKDEGKSIDAGQFLETWRPVPIPPTCLGKGSYCHYDSNCCAPFRCIGQEYNRGAGACGGFGSADSPFNEVNQLEEINEECTIHVISFVGSVLGIILDLFGVPGVGKKAFEELAGKIIDRGLPAILSIIDVKNDDSAPTKVWKIFVAINDLIGLGAILKAITGAWSVWDYIFNGVVLLAKFGAIIFSSGGFLLVLLANFFSAQLEVWNLLNSIFELATSCKNADKPTPPSGKCEDPSNRFCDGSTQYLNVTDVCYYDNQSSNYCWSPIQGESIECIILLLVLD